MRLIVSAHGLMKTVKEISSLLQFEKYLNTSMIEDENMKRLFAIAVILFSLFLSGATPVFALTESAAISELEHVSDGVLLSDNSLSNQHKVCRDFVVGKTGYSPWRKNAKRNARRKWENAVKTTPTLGSPYASWALAKGRDYNCGKKNGIHRCAAFAQPCIVTP